MGNGTRRTRQRKRTKGAKSAKLRAFRRKMGLYNKNSLPCEFIDVGNFIQSHTMDRHDMNKLTRNETNYDTIPSFNRPTLQNDFFDFNNIMYGNDIELIRNSSMNLEMCDTVSIKTEMDKSTESEITEYSIKKERLDQISTLTDVNIEGVNESEPIKAEIKEETSEETIETVSKENNANEEKDSTEIDSGDIVCCILCLNKTNVEEGRVLKDVQKFRDDIFKLTGRDINIFLDKCPLKACNHCIADLKKIKEIRTIMIKSQLEIQKQMYKEYNAPRPVNNLFEKIDANGIRPVAEIFEKSLLSIRENSIESISFADRLSSYDDNSYPDITQCVICDSSFESRDLLYYHHVIVHRGASCQCCGGKFKSLQSYLRHIYDTTANGDDNFKWKQCEDCNVPVAKYFMYFHKLQHQYEEVVDKERLSSTKNRQNHKLAENNKTSNSGEKKKDDGDETNDNETSDDEEINDNKTSDGDAADLNKKKIKQSVCTYCGKLVRTEVYKSHVGTHVVLQCELCGVLIPKTYMPKHQFTKHIDVSAICEVCGKGVRGARNLERHMRVHTGEKPFECKYCDRTFSVSHNKAAHERLHTNARPYKCTKCDKAYNFNASLKKHVLTSH